MVPVFALLMLGDEVGVVVLQRDLGLRHLVYSVITDLHLFPYCGHLGVTTLKQITIMQNMNIGTDSRTKVIPPFLLIGNS